MKDNLYFFHMIVFWLLVANIWWLFISMIVYTEWFLQYLFRFCLHHLLCFTDPEAQGNKEKIWILWEICFHCLLNDLQTKFKLIWTENGSEKAFWPLAVFKMKALFTYSSLIRLKDIEKLEIAESSTAFKQKALSSHLSSPNIFQQLWKKQIS